MSSSAETDHVIVPPPSSLNPIPALPIALRIDNKERFIELLLTPPPSNASTGSSFRQLLVFGKSNLRTLLMRQVLQDPNTRSFGHGKANAKNKNSNNKNWDELTSFPLPKNLQTNVIGTKLLLKKKKNDGSRIRTAWKGFEENGVKDDDIFGHPNELFQHVDVITYFIRPWDIDQTMEVIQRIKGCAINFNLANGGLDEATATSTSSSTRSKSHKQYHRIVYVPQITLMCTQILKDHHIHPMMNSVSIHSLQLDLFPLASDLISLEYDDCLRESGNVDGTPSSMIETTSRALRKLQDVVGIIPRIQSLGIWGEEVLTKLLNDTVDERYANEDNEAEEKVDEDELDDDLDSINGDDDDNNGNNTTTVMMLIDRRLDMVTPMVTPLTYEGLLDELVGIDCGFINVDEQIINPKDDNDEEEEEEEKEKEYIKKKASSNNPFGTEGESNKNPFDDDYGDNLDDNKNKSKTAPVAVNLVSLGVHAGNDTLYAEVRDQHVEKFGSFLQNQALVLKESHTNFTSKDTKKNLNEIHQFVKQIPIFTQSLRSLTNHIHLAELIKATTEDSSFRDQWNTERAMIEGESCYDILEECIFTNYPPYKLLRLLCLQSLCSGGIKSNRYDQFKQSIVQVYGYEFLPILHNIEKMGFIKRIENRGGGVFANLADGAGASSGGRSLFQSIKRNLILIHAEVNTTEPDDISYVSSGYAPLTVRLIQSAMQGWIGSGSGSSSSNENNKDDIIKDLFQMMSSMNNSGSGNGSGGSGGNRLLDIKQTYPPRDLPTTLRRQRVQQRSKGGRGGGGGTKGGSGGGGGVFESLGSYGKRKSITTTTTTTSGSSKNSGTKKKKKPTLIVVYLGGITYMEIASLRFLSKRDSFPYHIIVITTKVLNGTKLIQSME